MSTPGGADSRQAGQKAFVTNCSTQEVGNWGCGGGDMGEMGGLNGDGPMGWVMGEEISLHFLGLFCFFLRFVRSED